jgi:hypothetical protein
MRTPQWIELQVRPQLSEDRHNTIVGFELSGSGTIFDVRCPELKGMGTQHGGGGGWERHGGGGMGQHGDERLGQHGGGNGKEEDGGPGRRRSGRRLERR